MHAARCTVKLYKMLQNEIKTAFMQVEKPCMKNI